MPASIVNDIETGDEPIDGIVIAHFDHGIREDSAADARFVEELAKSYGLPFVTKREELGAQASEELARHHRHAFLREQAEKHNAVIATAHHIDDVVETIAINQIRGTGWRGLAVFGSKVIKRPLIELTKSDIYEYALMHHLEWVEDSTNNENKYLRNRVRRSLPSSLFTLKKQHLTKLWQAQLKLADAVDEETSALLLPSHEYSRYFMTHIETGAGTELLRAMVKQVTDQVPTRPQAERGLLAIKTAQPGAKFELGDGVTLVFTRTSFVVKTL